ncbi:MAG: nitrate reductase cytochrome c-type subunit [Rhodocyclaceae bacterium]|jgi:cytochrome c-type protein NapB|nr:nitrate reductase cytochrome c-type subunit [Rhodocyclaceae bacterium]
MKNPTRTSRSRTLAILLALGLGLTSLPPAALALDAPAPVKLQSLRGAEIQAMDPEGDGTRNDKDRPPIPRDFVQQPPLIPHSVKGYAITKNFNKCMDCHSWTRYKETGATKVSITHFKTRDGQELDSISPRRYFCSQCHIPQSDAKPLVNNTFRRAEGLSSK